MRMRYLVDARTIWLLSLFAILSILLSGASAVFVVQGRRETQRARAVAQRADSLVKDWVSRGCAPLTKSVP